MTKTQQAYIVRVRDALAHADSYQKLTKAQYIECLEELSVDIDGSIEAAREELAE